MKKGSNEWNECNLTEMTFVFALFLSLTTIISCLSGNDCTKHKCLAQGFDYSVEP